MKSKEFFREIIIILIASLILGWSFSLFKISLFLSYFISFLIIISLNILAKKILSYYFESDIKIKFWEWYRYGFRKDSHFKKPAPMFWLPLVVSLITRGFFQWLAILEFDIKAKTERVSRRHGLYRFSEITDWHVALIATAGIIINFVLAIFGYLTGFETFAKLNIYFALWSLIPLSNLDGSKILFGNKGLWLTLVIIASIFLGYSLTVI